MNSVEIYIIHLPTGKKFYHIGGDETIDRGYDFLNKLNCDAWLDKEPNQLNQSHDIIYIIIKRHLRMGRQNIQAKDFFDVFSFNKDIEKINKDHEESVRKMD